jgi:5-methylcytosine-specific restriction protein B
MLLEEKHVSDIDYLGILEYLKNNRELPYADPKKPGLTEEQKNQYLIIKKKGQNIVAELMKIYELCSSKYGLTKCEKVSWDDGSHQKTRKYLWVPMKYGDYAERHESISVFVEMVTQEKPVFRVSLELRNDKTKAEDVEKYHRHLELPIDKTAGLVYVSGNNELGRPSPLNESQEVIKHKVENKDYDKVQICKYISTEDYPTNEAIEAGILGAVKALLPYYEYVVGAVSENTEALQEMYSENIDFKYNRDEDETINISEFDKNMILYGPPGTGKTYSTAKYAVAICDGDNAPNLSDYSAVMKRYRQLMSEHRIAFVTFHQSYGYEEFIEGIKPVMDKNSSQLADSEGDKNGDIKYDVIDGVFKEFCGRARTSTVITKSQEWLISDSARVWKATVREDARLDCFENNRVRIDWGFDSDGAASFVEDVQKGDIIITTDGSRTVINGIAVAVTDEAEDLQADADSTSRKVIWLAKNINENIKALNKNKILHRRTVARVPNMTATDIISLAKKLNPQDDVLSKISIEENKKPYVFVIDEINRGNISKIFGELITLIEDTKREGLDECIPAILPYSGDEFTVPDNVYIIGTMNTADRSIALMDTALRRRFKFKEMLPDHELLKGVIIEEDDVVLDVEMMLKIINERITYLYDREHTIGHAIFMKLKTPGANTINNLASIFSKSVIPLLQEYFYEDYEKIRLVLGDNAKKDTATQFVIAEDVPDDTFEGDISDEIDIPEKSYRIEYDNFANIMAYKGISRKL